MEGYKFLKWTFILNTQNLKSKVLNKILKVVR